jgi:hypothetical protein
MLTFKQFIARHPNGQNQKPQKPKKLSVEAQIRKNLREAEIKADNESIYTLSKWDLIKWIAEEEGDTLGVEFNKDGTVTFQFVDVEIDFDNQ